MTSDLDRELTEILRSHDLRVTSQRLLIHRALRTLAGHVSADEVYDEVGPLLPGVTHQTVYSTLQLFCELELARRVIPPSGPTKFETRLEEHHHMGCRECGALIDLDVRVELEGLLDGAREAGFRPDAAMVTVVGLCGACRDRSAA
jgi:Fur family transcriptional regulator, stress-responsive regulator